MRKTPKVTALPTDMCACGHLREAHEHYRRGTECAICDVQSCSSFTVVTVPEYSRTR
ncbi:hypothetical protein [Microbacterium sp. zg-B96]|uniref:hypothetical protein n=1 Tax=Microbacterium sp. zg-B96 TaxID=3049069 RepID=UPI002550D52A|nr:hypothetical protein [Microbacterium sp. zg-B96]WIM16903.1 hypothetical protein QNO11_04470 [Microbacterium sp. zg-B96]